MSGRSGMDHRRPWQRRESLFNAYWCSAEGERLRRATQKELREANRLWWRHKDIREGRA